MLKPVNRDPGKPGSQWIPTRAGAIRIAVWYAVISALWILFSGSALHHFVQDHEWEALLENIKGWFFVSVTALLLGVTLDHYFRRIRRSASELQRSERSYRETFNATNEAIFLHDAATGRVLDVNEAMLRMHGYDSKEEYLEGRAEQALVTEPDYSWKEAQRRIRQAVEQGPQVFEWINHKKNGEPFWVEVSLRSSEIGGEGRVLAVVRDISQRKAQEIEISRLSRLYATLSEVNQVIVRCQSRPELFHETCQALVEFGNFRAATIGEKSSAAGQLITSARATEPASAGALVPIQCDVAAESARSGCPSLCNDALRDPRAACCHETMLGLGIQACAAFPLRLHGDVVGVLTVCANERDFFMAEENRLVEKIASNLSYALERLDEQEQREWVEARLRESEEKHRSLFESSRDAVMTLDAVTARFTACNPAALAMFGVATEAEFLTCSPMDFSPERQPDGRLSAECVRERNAALMEQGSASFEWLHRRSDGVEFYADVSLTRVEWGHAPAIMATVRDITDRKNAEHEIRRQASLIESLLDTVPDLIFFKDLQGIYLGCNHAFAGFVGRSREAIIGKTDHDLFPREVADFFRGQDEEMLKSLMPRQNEEWVNDPDGRRILLETLKTPYRGREGILLGVLGISRDITVRHEAQEKLRESEQRFRALVEVAPQAIFVRTGDQFAYLNGAALKLFGASSVEQLLGQPVLERFGAKCRHEVTTRISHLDQANESTLEVERVMLMLDGTEVEVSISAVPITFNGKQSALVFARDIADRKRAEAALWQQLELQNQLSKIAATVPGAIYSFRLRPDGSTAMPYASAALEGIFGLKPEDVREDATAVFALIHPEDAARVRQSILASAQTLKPWHEEFRGRGARQSDMWFEGHSVPQLELGGSVLWQGFLHDITERKQAEEQVRKLSRAVEQSQSSLVITDPEGNIEYVNPKFTQLTGYTQEEVKGKNPRMLKSGKTSAEDYRQLWQTIKRGETWRGEFYNRKKNGQHFWEFAAISPVTDDSGKITHFLAVKEDITDRKQLEAQLRQSQKLEAVGQLAGGVAHDFNNILAAMMMQAELASMVKDTPNEVREGLQEIRAGTERAASLTRQLLLFSRKQVMQLRNLDLNEVVTSLAKMLQRIIREDVRLQLHLHPAPLITRADAGMLDQVLMNLAVNARDAMPKGGSLLIETSEETVGVDNLRNHPDAAPGRYVSMSVTDTGSGMTPEVMLRVFEPFFTTKEPGKGTGLGLATVFGIVKQHRGWVTVQSEPGKGARFQVYLPVAEGDATKKSLAARPVFRGGTETIFLVEDDPSVRRMTRTLLARHGYTVIEAATGVEALEVWKQHRDAVALLLTDLVMPAGITGQQLARELQKSKPDLRVVFTSGYSAEIAGGEIRLRHGENFVQKPCAPAVLLETIRKTLES